MRAARRLRLHSSRQGRGPLRRKAHGAAEGGEQGSVGFQHGHAVRKEKALLAAQKAHEKQHAVPDSLLFLAETWGLERLAHGDRGESSLPGTRAGIFRRVRRAVRGASGEAVGPCLRARAFVGEEAGYVWSIFSLKCFAFQTIRPVVSRKKRGFFRSLRAGRRCAAASRSAFFKGGTLCRVAE